MAPTGLITFSEAQLVGWLSPILWPFFRVLAMFTAAPLFSIRAIPARAKVGLAFFVAVCAQPMLAEQPMVMFNGPAALETLLQQLAVGLALGFTVRLVFASVELGGEVIGLQMGLNFASFFDPTSNAQISAVGRFYGQMALLLFVVINGHLLLIMAVVDSFTHFPVNGNFLQSLGQMKLHQLGSSLFASALWIALPLMALLLFVNLTMGVISRVAPQMNIYAVGFPVTLTVGLLGIMATLPMLEHPILTLMQQAIDLFSARR